MLAGGSFNLVASGIYWLVAGKQLPPSFAVVAAASMGYLCIFIAVAPRHPQTPNNPAGPRFQELRAELDRINLQKVKLVIGPDSLDFPRPLALGPSTTIPLRIAETWSKPALTWSTKTDSTASYRLFWRGTFGLMFGFLLALTATALGERLGWPSGYWLLPVSLGFGVFLMFCVYGFRLQIRADKEFTRSPEDRLAAKEALSYPYFAQGDKPPFKRWMFLRAGLRGRARRLGIELERGYRVPDSD